MLQACVEPCMQQSEMVLMQTARMCLLASMRASCWVDCLCMCAGPGVGAGIVRASGSHELYSSNTHTASYLACPPGIPCWSCFVAIRKRFCIGTAMPASPRPLYQHRGLICMPHLCIADIPHALQVFSQSFLVYMTNHTRCLAVDQK